MSKSPLGEQVRVPVQLCLRCGELLSAASAMGKTATPKDGDVTICIRCAHVMAFTDTQMLRELTPEEKADVMKNDRVRKAIAAVVLARRATP